MQIENLLIGIILLLIGIFGIIDSTSSPLKKSNDTFGGNTKYLFGSIGVLAVGLYLIFKEIAFLF